jgi:hypothetical protein
MLWRASRLDVSQQNSAFGSPVVVQWKDHGSDHVWGMREELLWLVDDDWWYDVSLLFVDWDDPAIAAMELSFAQEVKVAKQTMSLAIMLERVLVLPTFSCRHSKRAAYINENNHARCPFAQFFSVQKADFVLPNKIRESSILFNERYHKVQSDLGHSQRPRTLSLDDLRRIPSVSATYVTVLLDALSDHRLLRIGPEVVHAFATEKLSIPFSSDTEKILYKVFSTTGFDAQ